MGGWVSPIFRVRFGDHVLSAMTTCLPCRLVSKCKGRRTQITECLFNLGEKYSLRLCDPSDYLIALLILIVFYR